MAEESPVFWKSQLQIATATPVSWALLAIYALSGIWTLFDAQGAADVLGVRPALVAFDLLAFDIGSPTIAFALLRSVFVHSGFVALFCGMAALYAFSQAVETLMGSWRYAVFFLACGVAGGIGQSLADPAAFTPVCNGSAGVFGAMAAHVALRPWASIRCPTRGGGWFDLPAWLAVAFAVVVVAFAGERQAVSALVGAAAGLLLTPIFCPPGQRLNVRLASDPEYGAEAGAGFRMPLLPSFALALLPAIGLAGWAWQVQTGADAETLALARESIAISRLISADAPQQTAGALALYRQAAEVDPAIANRLAKRLYNGRSVPADRAEAMRWFARAAERDQPEAMETYALALIKGDQVARAPDQGAAMLIKLGKMGYSAGNLQLGLISQEGIGGAVINLPAAARYYQLACENSEWSRAKRRGRAGACYRWSTMLMAGDGVAKDEAKAKSLLERAGTEGSAEAKEMLLLLQP